MATSKNKSRANIWAALDAANATTALNNYTTAAAAVATAQSLANTLDAKKDIVSSKVANNTDAVIAAASMPSTTKSIKVVDAAGAIVGYLAAYANASLT